MSSWFKSVVAIINQITLLTVVLTGAAVIREREHGTLEHLLVMPLTAFEIAMAKVWANGLVILVATGGLAVPDRAHGAEGAVRRFGRAVVRRASCSICSSRRRSGYSWGRSRGRWRSSRCLIILVIVVLMLLSGGSTPVESQPKWLQYLTYLLPARHFVSFSQVIIYRGGGLSAVWSQFLMVGGIGLGFFVYSLALFRKSIAVTK